MKMPDCTFWTGVFWKKLAECSNAI